MLMRNPMYFANTDSYTPPPHPYSHYQFNQQRPMTTTTTTTNDINPTIIISDDDDDDDDDDVQHNIPVHILTTRQHPSHPLPPPLPPPSSYTHHDQHQHQGGEGGGGGNEGITVLNYIQLISAFHYSTHNSTRM